MKTCDKAGVVIEGFSGFINIFPGEGSDDDISPDNQDWFSSEFLAQLLHVVAVLFRSGRRRAEMEMEMVVVMEMVKMWMAITDRS